MTRNRLEALSDGVIAIIMTIMAFELRPPDGIALSDLVTVTPKFLSYVLSFVFLAIYWNNHHHLMQAVQRINGAVLWANIHLLFWLSLVPVTTAWIGDSSAAALPVAVYGIALLFAGCAYFILTRTLLAVHGPDSQLAAALGRDWKGKSSVIAYAVAIPLAFVHSAVAIVIYAGVAVLWLVPDRRIERTISAD